MAETEIAWQNKDVISKYFADHLKGKSLRAYGLDLPEIEAVLPTNLPMIEANEMRADNVLLLADHSIAIVDYESDYSEDDKQKYVHYVNRVVRRYRREWKEREGAETRLTVRMIVIYTADITRRQVETVFDVGCLRLKTEAAFLSELDSAEIRERLNRKILSGEGLTEEEKMQFVILPMSYKGDAAKQEAIRENLDLAEQMTDETERMFLLTGMVVMTNKVIEQDDLERVRRMIGMTRLMRMLEEEKQQAIEQAVAEERKKAAARIEKEKAETERGIAKRMLANGIPVQTILQCSSVLSRQDIEALAAQS